MSMDGVSIIVPVYNEEAILKSNISALSKFVSLQGISHQILIADNGSTDRTPDVGRQLMKDFSNISYLRIDRKSVGGAFWLGVEKAIYEKIVTVDVDLSIDLQFIVSAYRLLDEYDIVVGSKIAGSQERSVIRTIGSALYIKLANLFLCLPVTDYSIGAKAYRKPSIGGYAGKTSEWTGYVIELIAMAKKDGLKIIEMPVNCRDTRKGKFNIIHEGFYRYWHLLKLIFQVRLG